MRLRGSVVVDMRCERGSHVYMIRFPVNEKDTELQTCQQQSILHCRTTSARSIYAVLFEKS